MTYEGNSGMRIVLALALCLLAGCAPALPARPQVAFYVDPDPLLIPQEPVARPGLRAITPAPVPAPICMTDADHLALETYFDQIEALRR